MDTLRRTEKNIAMGKKVQAQINAVKSVGNILTNANQKLANKSNKKMPEKFKPDFRHLREEALQLLKTKKKKYANALASLEREGTSSGNNTRKQKGLQNVYNAIELQIELAELPTEITEGGSRKRLGKTRRRRLTRHR